MEPPFSSEAGTRLLRYCMDLQSIEALVLSRIQTGASLGDVLLSFSGWMILPRGGLNDLAFPLRNR